MNKKDAARIIRQRTHPSLFDFCYLTTRSHLKTFWMFKDHLAKHGKPVKILDLGCGQKPFQSLLKGLEVEHYVGVDFDSGRSVPDIVGPIDELPISDNSFDAIIATEVFEHTLNLEKAVTEMRRVAKDGALAYISTPFMFSEHGAPYDFQRITRYKYFELFKNDEILMLKETNTSLATLFFLSNVCWENTILKRIPLVTPLFYALNNVFGLGCEIVIEILSALGERVFHKKREWFRQLMQNQFYTMPGGYNLIVKMVSLKNCR